MLAPHTTAAQRAIWPAGAYGNTAALAQAISRGITKAGTFLGLSCVQSHASKPARVTPAAPCSTPVCNLKQASQHAGPLLHPAQSPHSMQHAPGHVVRLQYLTPWLDRATKAGVGVETLNLENEELDGVLSALKRCKGFVIGSPTLGGHMPTQHQLWSM